MASKSPQKLEADTAPPKTKMKVDISYNNAWQMFTTFWGYSGEGGTTSELGNVKR